MIVRKYYRPRNSRRVTNTNNLGGTVATPTPTLSGGKMRVTTNVPIVISSPPASWKVQGVSPTTATQVSLLVWDIGYAATVVVTNTWVIAANDPAARTENGGFVSASSGTF